jgi:hypothetical protein
LIHVELVYSKSSTASRSTPLPSKLNDDDSRTPGVILAIHEILRRENFPVVSLVAGRRVSDSRVFVSTWLKSQQRDWILPLSLLPTLPERSIHIGTRKQWSMTGLATITAQTAPAP